jgi:predicted dehydrogenase
MRFALLGDHPDGLDMARALAESGRHELMVYSGPPVGAEYLRRWGLSIQQVGDLEEVLADPAIDALIVAGSLGDRPAQLRRALQSERHVLCLHPADQVPDAAYEALMIQADTGQVLLPLLPEALHPAVARLAELARPSGVPGHAEADGVGEQEGGGPAPICLLTMERWSTEQVLVEADAPGKRPGLPGWDVLRRVGGEVAEVSAFAAAEEVTAEAPLLLAGRFEAGGLFQVALVPQQSEPRWRLTLVAGFSRAELTFPLGWPGPARLTWQDETGTPREQSWEGWNPWPALVEAFEAALALPKGGNGEESSKAPLSWRDEVRCLELDDAARRSVARRRTSTLEYQTATEEASFKGTMTLFGCALLWASLALLILSVWVPWLGWLIAPLFGVFLLLQLLRWALPARPEAPPAPASRGPGPAGSPVEERRQSPPA